MSYLSRVAVVAGVYFGAAKLGLQLAEAHNSITAVWPPTGIALAALILWGYRMWPAVALGALLANTATGIPPLAVAGIATGNTLEALFGAFLLQRVAGFRPQLDRIRDVVALALLAGFVSTTVSATVGITSLLLCGAVDWGGLPSAWRVWWLGDMGGVMLIAPLVLVMASTDRWHVTLRRGLEAVAMLGALLVAAILTFALAPLPVFIWPPLIWTALRFRQKGAAVGNVLVAAVGAAFTANGTGPFAHGSQDASLLLSQCVMAVSSTVSLTLAAVMSQRTTAEAALRRAHDELESKVQERTAQLYASEAILAEAQRVARIGSWEWKVAEDELTWSAELHRICGLEPETFGASYAAFLECVHPGDRARVDETVQKAFIEQRRFEFDHRIVRPDGSVRVLHGQGQVVANDRGETTRMLGTCQDVTEQRALEAEQERARQEADRLKEQFFALVSHELRTPLTSIKGYAELLEREVDGDAAASRFLAVIARNTDRLERLVGDLLFAAKADAGEFTIERELLPLEDVVSGCVDAASPFASARGIELHLEVAGSLPTVGDKDRLSQLFDNLVSNAIKYSREGGSVMVRLWRDDSVHVEVRDGGIGIPEADLERIFERFFRSSRAEADAIPGVGLGLSISKAIVDAHRGRITVESEEGRGAAFRVSLPLYAEVGLTPAEA
jgi:PAS domain S-box-containing protein